MSEELRDFVKAALIAKGMNGLNAFDGEGCACHVDDLMPCDQPQPDCKACVLKTIPAGECKDPDCEWSEDEHFHTVEP